MSAFHRSDAADHGRRLAERRVDRTAHGAEVLEHRFQTGAVANLDAAQIRDAVRDVLDARVDGFDEVFARVAPRRKRGLRGRLMGLRVGQLLA
jgi:hypothetical protein